MSDDLFVQMSESYQDSNKATIELRYNRERRLENAPENVKLLHDPSYIKKQSFFTSIWSNKGHRFIFIAILILASLNASFFFYYYNSSSGKIDGIKVQMETFQYNGDVLVNVIFNESKNIMQKNIKAYVRGINTKEEETSFSESKGVYIGAKLILHFKVKNKDLKKVETIIMIDKKVLNLSKKI